MPFCGRVERFRIIEGPEAWKVSIDTHFSSAQVSLGKVVLSAFPNSLLISSNATGEVTRLTLHIPRQMISREELEQFLRLLQRSVTIEDSADESHALSIHALPHSSDEPDTPNWQNTAVGKLVVAAKSYHLASGSKPKTKELAALFIDWIARHPRYRRADVVVSPPPSNASKTFDLPEVVATEIERRLDILQVNCAMDGDVVPQKSLRDNSEAKLKNLSGKYRVKQDLVGKTVLLVDDIYETGATISELARACRSAGAATILSLTATKTALEARGYSASRWYQALYGKNEITRRGA